MTMVYLRIILAALLFIALGVGAVPLLVLVSLSGGGTGYGLCPDGISACELGYLSPVEMSVWLVGTLFVLVALIHLIRIVWHKIDQGPPGLTT